MQTVFVVPIEPTFYLTKIEILCLSTYRKRRAAGVAEEIKEY